MSPAKKFTSPSETDPPAVKPAAAASVTASPLPPPDQKKPPNPLKKHLGRLALITFLLLGLLALPIVYLAFVGQQLKAEAQALQVHGLAAANALKAQDLPTAKVELEQTAERLAATQAHYQRLGFLKYSPLRAYYRDGQHLLNAGQAGIDAGETLIAGLEPYADILGLQGAGSFTGGTAEDRLVQLVSTLEELEPTFNTLQEKLAYINQEIGAIDPDRYPFHLNGQPASDLIINAKTQLSQADELVTTLKPIVQELPDIMGAKGEKTYLVLFQNDAELRPTGGFMTAYAIVTVNSGKVTPVKSDDMYDLDAKFTQRIPPPDVVKQYLLVNRLNLRDMNLSPDFKESMTAFMGFYNDLPGEPAVDGVIAIDTKVLTDLLTVLGDIDVPGYGRFSAQTDDRCNCPQVIYELEDIIGRPTPFLRSERKAILGPMMQTILFKAYGSGNETWPSLFQTFFANLTEKHVLFYFPAERQQAAFEANNFAGRLLPVNNTDYLHINDANFGGAKSNLFITQEVEQDIEVQNDQVKKTLTLTYKNPVPGSNCNLEAGELCLNGMLGNWQRLYLPLGSQLLDAKGYLDGSVKEYEELGKSVIEGFFKLAPESQATITLTYTVPYQPQGTYQLQLQKQPGTKSPTHTVSINGQRQEFVLIGDTLFELSLEP